MSISKWLMSKLLVLLLMLATSNVSAGDNKGGNSLGYKVINSTNVVVMIHTIEDWFWNLTCGEDNYYRVFLYERGKHCNFHW